MYDKQKFAQYLAKKRKRQAYIDAFTALLDSFYATLKDAPPTPEAIDAFIRSRWSGYVSKDKERYRLLNDYADFCKAESPVFANAFEAHVRETFEGEARKAMKAYKQSLVPIPEDTKIAPAFLGGLTNDEFVQAFKALQALIYTIYNDIEHGSPFEWGWCDWKDMTWEGLNHNRVIMVLDALVNSGHMNGDVLVVDKACFDNYSFSKPMPNINLLLRGLISKGFHIEERENKKSPVFTLSYPNTPNLLSVLCAYFMLSDSDSELVRSSAPTPRPQREDGNKNHVTSFSYRFVEDPAAQTRETFFLAKTDGEPEPLREMYYWLYDEAVKYGFSPTGQEHMGCYLYKKGNKEWLLLGSGHSYHEPEFLHSPNYALAAKVRFRKVFYTQPEKIDYLKKRFPDAFNNPWNWCYKTCKTYTEDCKMRVTFDRGNQDYRHSCAKAHFYFHNPDFNDVKAILELYKLDNNIK